MSERITIQDIADALGLSRNTVSKAINNTGNIAEDTRILVLNKAAEMGYKQFSYIDIASRKLTITKDDREVLAAGEYVLLMTAWVDSSHFASLMIDHLQHELSLFGASLTMYRILPEQLRECRLPSSIDIRKIRGIFCTEIFHVPYVRMLTQLEIPVVFVDAPVLYGEEPLAADIVLMDNTNYVYELVRRLRDRGTRRFGFVGNISHCRSFYERYIGFRSALEFYGIPSDPSWSLLSWEDSALEMPGNSHEAMVRALNLFMDRSEELPEIFFCANDFVALDLLNILKARGIRVPERVMLCGFDDSQESRIVTPAFTTVHIHSQVMGSTAMELMLTRLRQPDMYFRTIHTETNLVLRASTGDDGEQGIGTGPAARK